MLIPINTDAPLYHFPYGTIALIVINTLCFLLTGCAMDHDRLEPWMLEYGNGLNPLEWLTSMFAHGGFSHLIGNMFFLWGFGLVVEGKLGLRRFVMLYLGIGLLQSACVDLLTLHRTDDYVLKNVLKAESVDQLAADLAADFDLDEEDARQLAPQWIALHKGRCLGASGAIFGLMAIALVWAPKNEMHVVGFLLLRVLSFDVSIMWYSIFYIAMNVLGVVIDKFEMGSAGLHMIGGIIGFAAGVIYLKKDWVDCERWDLFAVLSGKYGRFADENWALGAHAHTDKVYSDIPLPTGADTAADGIAAKARQRKVASANRDGDSPGVVKVSRNLQPIASLIDDGDFIGASEMMYDLRMVDSDSRLDQERLKRFALGLLQADVTDDAEIYLDEYIERFPDDAIWAKIRLAHLLITLRQRPAAAVKLLRTMRGPEMSEQQKNQARKLIATAKKQISQGIQDAEPEW